MSTTATSRPITTLVPEYGSNRTLAAEVGARLEGCAWVGVPFAGGMTELRHIKARTILVGDLHEELINLAKVLAHPKHGPDMIRRLRRTAFHEHVLADSQEFLKHSLPPGRSDRTRGEWELQHALAYFIATWMGRNGMAGTDRELEGGLSIRYQPDGGDSCKRFRSATEALLDWRQIFRRCTFVVRDVFEFLDLVADRPDVGIYCDPPFPGPGDAYRHQFSEEQHTRLAAKLSQFTLTRVVCRFYDHPLIRRLYPETGWTWSHFTGRKTSGVSGDEVILERGRIPEDWATVFGGRDIPPAKLSLFE